MNRLILIGNGFDLAHGLKTRYNDFILWYLKSCFTQSVKEREYKDNLISIVRNYNSPFELGRIKSISDLIDYYYKNGFKDLLLNREISFADTGTTYKNFFTVTVHSALVKQLLLNCTDANWVEIENEFYYQLKGILTERDSDYKIQRLSKLNLSLKTLIYFLEQYLQTIQRPDILKNYLGIFESKIRKEDVVTVKLTRDIGPDETQILNFNYTSTIEEYFKGNLYSGYDYNINYIHGKVGDEKNPLIFGFGDELDESYLQMELEKAKGFLEYIKSFWYFKTSNYHNLIRFIESADFQVYILGHSCGLSDRTMLNMIFEHENCKSIKIYYYKDKEGNNNFTSLTQEISRHFRNKGIMRKKIVPFDKSIPMPQFNIG